MKYLLLLAITFSCLFSKAQTLNYYNYESPEKWQTITVMLPSGNDKAGKAFYNSSTANSVVEIHEGKELRQDTISASIVTLGTDAQKYILVTPESGKYIVLSDEKQMFTTVFYLDSNLFNPQTEKQQPVSSLSAANLARKFFKLLLLL